MNARELVWEAHLQVMTMSSPAPHRAVARFGPIVCNDFGVPHEWGLQASAGLSTPTEVDVINALAWMRDRGAVHGWRATVPQSIEADSPWPGLTVIDTLPVFAVDTARVNAISDGAPAGFALDVDPSYEDVIAGYGGWMGDTALAELLVTPEDVERVDRRFVVAHLAGRAVGCAFVWFAGDTGYLSGIGVVEEFRGRGIGRTLTAVAARLGSRAPHGGPTEVVWMFATDEGAALYEHMGFERIDTEVALTER